MATIDLGKIKLVWRGTYSGSTAYTVDDVVQHTDSGLTSSFICTTASTGNAPSTGGSVHGSWAYLAKGAAGSVLTTQGDILYRDGSGDQRLAKGTAAQTLKMNSGATAPEWTTVAAPTNALIKTYSKQFRGGQSISGFSMATPSEVANYNISITPQSANSVFLIDVNLTLGAQVDHTGIQVKAKIGSGSYTHLGTGASDMYNNSGYFDFGSFYEGGDSNQVNGKSHIFYYAPATTSAITFALFCGQHSSTAYFGRSSGGSTDDYTAMGMTLRLDEYNSTTELVNARYTSG